MDIQKISRTFGLHPMVGFGMFAVDMMLFGAETLTFELTLPLSIGIGAALTLPSILIQHYSFKDEWGAAIGKGLLIGVLTAIPTSLPSMVPLLGGALGTVKLLKSDSDKEPPRLETSTPPQKETETIIEGEYEEEN